MLVLLHKSDQVETPVSQGELYEIEKPLGGGATRNAIANFLAAWFAQPNLVSNFRLAQGCPVEAVYQRVARLTGEEYQLEMARSKA